MLTTYADDRSVIEALRAGARGYLTKDAGADPDPRRTPAGHQRPARRRPRRPAAPARQRHRRPGQPARPTRAQFPAGLTAREADVLRLIARGLSNAEIASRLVVSDTTVKSHINHLYAKTGVRDRAQAVAYAYQHGLT